MAKMWRDLVAVRWDLILGWGRLVWSLDGELRWKLRKLKAAAMRRVAMYSDQRETMILVMKW